MDTGFCTDKGLVRKTNQDAIFSGISTDGKIGLFLIADGMGGHMMGELASGRIVQDFEQWWLAFEADEYRKSAAECVDELKNTLNGVNSYIFNQYSRGKDITGSTVALLLIYDDRYYVLSVGDTRVYSVKGKNLRLVTVDHTLRTELENRTGVSETDIMNNPRRDALTQAVGAKQNLDVFTAEGEVGTNRFLICSDGVYKPLDDAGLKKYAASYMSAGRICSALQKKVVESGATDNYSMYYVYPEQAVNDRKTRLWIKGLICAAGVLLAVLLVILLMGWI